MQRISPHAQRKQRKLLEEIARHTVPIRPNRQDERNLKVKGFVGFVYRVAA